MVILNSLAYRNWMAFAIPGHVPRGSNTTLSGGGPHRPSHFGEQGKRPGLHPDEIALSGALDHRVAEVAARLAAGH